MARTIGKGYFYYINIGRKRRSIDTCALRRGLYTHTATAFYIGNRYGVYIAARALGNKIITGKPHFYAISLY